MKKIYFLFLTVLFANLMQAQTVLISPTGDGGFENGTTFAANGWTVENFVANNTNKWFLGNISTPSSGTNAAYISDNATGSTYNYLNSSATRVLFWRDVVFPSSETVINLSFKLKVTGEADYDELSVFVQNSGTVPATSTQPSASGSSFPTIANTTRLRTISVNGGSYITYNVAISSLDAGNASSATTRRLIFLWENDGGSGAQPPASIDEISLISSVPAPLCNANGSFTIDNTLPNNATTTGGNFSSFTNAINYVNANGICGALTFNVAAGQSFAESVPALTATGSLTDPIIFQKAGTGANPKIVTSGSASSIDFGFCISGGDYITLDGIDILGTVGAAVEYGYLIRNGGATNGAQNNTIKNTTITLSRSGSNSVYGIYQTATTTGGGFTPTASTGANSFNKYFNFNISNARNNGIYLLANGGFRDIGCEIGTTSCTTRNVISNVGPTSSTFTGAFGIQTVSQENCKIYNTDISAIAGNQSSTHGIYMTTNNGTCEIYKNKIQDISVFGGTSTTSSAYGIRADQNTAVGTNVTKINNNFVSNVFTSRTSANATRYVFGVFVGNASALGTHSYEVDNNSISIGQGLNTAISSACFEVQNNSSVYLVRNNIFANFTAAQGATAKHYCVRYTSGTWGATGSVSNYNDYFVANDAGTSGFVSQVNTTNYATLATHVAALTTPASQDANSVSLDPSFTNNNTNLHSGATGLNNVGLTIAGITDDIDCEVRNAATPDIGADEFNVSALDMGAFALVSPSIPVCNNPAATVTVTIKNFGSAAIDFSVNPTTLTVNVTGAATTTLTQIINTGTLAAGATQNVAMATTLNMATGGIYTFNANTAVVGDGNATNDAMVAVNRTIAASVSLPQCIDFTGFSGADLSTFFPNWLEATGSTSPAGNTSSWTSQTGLGAAANVSAKVNLYQSSKNEWIVGPKLIPTALTSLVFDAAITEFGAIGVDATGMAGTDDNVKVKISTDCGVSWTTLYTYDATNTAAMTASAALTNNAISLAAYAGQNVIIAFHATEGTIDDLPDYDFHIDNVCIKNLFPIDGSATALAAPTATQCYGVAETVSITFKNTGTSTIDFSTNALAITTNVTGAATATLTGNVITGTLAPNATINVPMSALLDMSAAGTYTFNATATLTGDGDVTNDALVAVNRTVTVPTVATFQPSSASITAGSTNAQVLRLDFTTNKCGNVTNITLNTNGTTAAADITKARLYYTTTSTFSTTTAFGTEITNPNGAMVFTGSQVPSTTQTNYFWLVYDVSCNATTTNVIDAELTSIEIGANTFTPAPATANPSGTRAIAALFAPTRTDANSTTAVTLGTQNARFAYALIAGSAVCPSTLTDINFTVTNPNPTDVVNAKAYYTTTSTFSNAVQFGSSIANPASGTLSFSGTQLLAAGNNYFWVVYDISCTGTVAASLNADINSLVVNGNTIPVTGTATAANTLSAITAFTTVADGEWNNSAIWACGAIPLTNTTSVIIDHNITVSTLGNIGGSVTINAGKSLTIDAGGELTLGTIGGGNRVLTNNGTLSVLGGTLNQNGNLLVNSGAKLNQSGGAINIDGNAAAVLANSVPSGTNIINFNVATNTDINLTGGVFTLVDPHADLTTSFLVNYGTIGSILSSANHTFRFGDGVSTDNGSARGFEYYSYSGSGIFTFGNVIIESVVGGTNRFVNISGTYYNLVASGNLTINAGAELRQVGTSLTGAIAVAKDLTVNTGGILTAPGIVYLGKLTSSGSTTVVGAPSTDPQTFGGAGTFRNSVTSPTSNVSSLTVNNTSTTGVTLNVPFSIGNTLALSNGVINTSNTNLLTLGTSAASSGTLTYNAGRVNGPFKRWIGTTTGARQFPVGTASLLEDANINFTAAPTAGGSLTAQWIGGAPGFPNTTPLTEGSLNVAAVSNAGQWQIDAADGLTGGTYTATFRPLGNLNVIDFSKSVLVKRPSAGGDWTLNGVHVTTTGTNAAPVLSRTGMSGFSQFAIGGELNVALPIRIDYITGRKNGSVNNLDWKVTCTNSPTVELTLERSGNGSDFKAINIQNETQARCDQPFAYTDASPLKGKNYYRVKVVGVDGIATYSRVVTLLNADKGFELISIAPNPVNEASKLNIASAKADRVTVTIVDQNGKIASTNQVVLVAGSNTIPLASARLAAGSYHVIVTNQEGERKNLSFVKQ
jgi:hypothetical protein